jgi:hypothetical protein
LEEELMVKYSLSREGKRVHMTRVQAKFTLWNPWIKATS